VRQRYGTVRSTGGLREEEFLRLTASLEHASEHLLAEALVRGAKERGLTLAGAATFESGKGVTAAIDGHQVAIGNATFKENSPWMPERCSPKRKDSASWGRP